MNQHQRNEMAILGVLFLMGALNCLLLITGVWGAARMIRWIRGSVRK